MLVSYKFKFIVETLEKTFVLFARTELERDVWVEAICRIVDYNVTGVKIDIRRPSPSFEQLKLQYKNKHKEASQVLYNSQAKR